MNGSPVPLSPPPLPGGHPALAQDNDYPSPGSYGGFNTAAPGAFRRGSEPAVSAFGFGTTPNPGRPNRPRESKNLFS